MKTVKNTNSLAETENLALKFAKNLKGGEVIQLIGDVGAGKTSFTKGLVKGLNSKAHVSSPTFTICNIYEGRLRVYHCDFYRLEDDKLIVNEINEMLDDESVIVLEWAENIKALKDFDDIKVNIKTDSESGRTFEFEIASNYEYLEFKA